MTANKTIGWVVGALVGLAGAASARAQQAEADGQVGQPTAAEDAQAVAPQEAKPDDGAEGVESRLERIEAQLQQQQEQLQQTRRTAEEQRAQAEDLRAQVDELRAGQEATEQTLFELQQAWSDRLSLYGFFDTSFTMAFPTGKHKWENPIFAATPRYSTFYQNRINLYFHAEPSETTEALLEVRFTYQPSGTVTQYPVTTYVGAVQLPEDGAYKRTNTTVYNAYSGSFRLGGVMIERAQFDWKPFDWLHLRVGRFLTPFGIFNESHSPLVIVTASQPFLITHGYLPTAQTGAMLFGRVFPSEMLDFEYAVTVSNGRGPADEFYDLDKNKAVGLRLRGRLHAGDLEVAAGGYGYMGRYTDVRNTMVVYLDDTASGFADADPPVRYVETVADQYDELLLSADLDLSFKGLRLYGEYAWGKVAYQVPVPVGRLTPLLLGTDPTVEAVEADHIKQAVYGVLAYTLPVRRWRDRVAVTPFAGFDYLSPNDAYDVESLYMIQFGVNVRPAPFVVFKSNAYCIIPTRDSVISDTTWYWINTVGVSF